MKFIEMILWLLMMLWFFNWLGEWADEMTGKKR